MKDESMGVKMQNKENNFMSAVLYIHNDEQIIKEFIERLCTVFNSHFKKYEIICVNDCSDDKSVEIIRDCAKNMGEGVLVLISTGFYQGLESSMIAGVDYASGDFVFEFDNIYIDYDINEIMNIYNHCINGCDIVGASSEAKVRKSSRLFYSLFNKHSYAQYKIKTESFRILSRRAINRINQMSITIPYRKAIYASCGLKYENRVLLTASAVHNNDNALKPQNKRFGANTTVNPSYRQGLALDSIIIFTNIAYKISLVFTVVMILFSVISGIYTLAIFLSGNPVAGWTTTMLMLSVGFFGIFGILSIVIKYLSLIVSLIFKKTKYIIGNIERL
ncbi:MAG: glycosyltransferase [Lachnospiraceae bacterium]|nr:glycosyltransferase [Lachnospiraceae bacterium]